MTVRDYFFCLDPRISQVDQRCYRDVATFISLIYNAKFLNKILTIWLIILKKRVPQHNQIKLTGKVDLTFKNWMMKFTIVTDYSIIMIKNYIKFDFH